MSMTKPGGTVGWAPLEEPRQGQCGRGDRGGGWGRGVEWGGGEGSGHSDWIKSAAVSSTPALSQFLLDLDLERCGFVLT